MTIWLAMTTADGDERSFPITKRRTVIGRDSQCDVRIAVPTVAVQHCEILLDGEIAEVHDLDSLTGTFRNGNRVDRAILDVNDRLTIGPTTFVIRRLEAMIVSRDGQSPSGTQSLDAAESSAT